MRELIENFVIKLAKNKIKKALNTELNINIAHQSLPEPQKTEQYMLYIHVPFCHTFCPYCSFHKYAFEQEKVKEYFTNLRCDLVKIKNKGYDFSTLYVGGGTTLIDESELEKTLILAKELFGIKEISCESDPSHIDDLSRFRGLIDRLSVGVQSFDDEILRKIGRFEKFGSGEAVRDKLEKAAQILPILSVDLIFNFPNQSEQMLARDIELARSTKAKQLTFYPLMKSELTAAKISGALGKSAQDNERKYYELICQSLSDEFSTNNVWSFSRLGKSGIKDEYVSSFHQYLGAGSGAFSFLASRLYINDFDLDDYAKSANSTELKALGSCAFSEQNKAYYLLLCELFDGEIDIKSFCAKNDIKAFRLQGILLALRACGALYKDNKKFVLTPFGRYLVVVLMKEFYTGMDKLRAVFSKKTLKMNENINIMEASV